MSVDIGLPRAPRVAMDTLVLIRRAGEDTWRRGRTINISRTGLLLQTDGLQLDPPETVEVVVALPVFGDLAPTRILGTGRIVRAVAPSPPDSDPVMAAHLDTYRVLRDEDGGDQFPAD
jgi:hypothetical protein